MYGEEVVGMAWQMGNVFAMLGAALAIALPGIASSIGMSWVQRSAAGVITEQPEKFGKTMILQLIPSSATLYGFVVAFLIMGNAVMLGEGEYGYDAISGLTILAAALPIALVGFFGTLMQAKVCVAGVQMVGKDDSLSGRALVMAVFIELFVLFALIVSILSVFSVETITTIAETAAAAY
ncbi:MAG: V-type ATP synthase subunit K [Firmicutes bacterium]|nr:V-type ATP synthase subunit K [Bacillota bacterium]